MDIAIIGASAGIGLETVKRALDRGHGVRALSRSAIPLPAHPRLRAVRGNALDRSDLENAILGADAVVVALGTRGDKNFDSLYSNFAKLLFEVQGGSGSQAPFIFVTGFGAGESRGHAGWAARLFLDLFLKEVYADKGRMEEMLANSKLNWIVVRPGRLVDKPLTEKYRVESGLRRGMRIGAVRRADVADLLVKQAEEPTGFGKFLAVSQR